MMAVNSGLGSVLFWNYFDRTYWLKSRVTLLPFYTINYCVGSGLLPVTTKHFFQLKRCPPVVMIL